MNCTEVENRIVDFVERAITLKEEEEINQHISTCNACKRLYRETEEVLVTFGKIPKAQPSSKLEMSFKSMLKEEKELQSKGLLLKPKTKNSWKSAFQVAASIVLVFSGYFVGSFSTTQSIQKEIVALQNESKTMRENLMLAMVDSRSPSKRIKAVNYTEEFVKPDIKVLKALIERIQYDSNSNVRLSAAEALSRFSESELVRTSLIERLTTEKDPSIQIEIIQILVKAQEKRALEPLKKILEQPELPQYMKDQVTIGISELI